MLGPPKGGTRIRVIEFPPEGEQIRQLSVVKRGSGSATWAPRKPRRRTLDSR